MKNPSKTNWININEVSVFLLYSAYFTWKRATSSTLLPYDLTHVQFMLLMPLGFLKEDEVYVSQNNLAKFLSFDVSMTSRVLCVLEKRGFLKSSQTAGNERSKFSELTDAGMAKIQKAAKDLLKAKKSFSSSLDDDKRGFDEHLRSILQQQIEYAV